MTNPVTVEVTRGKLVESRHRGSLAVVDDSGELVCAIGDADARVFPRSAIKVLQALPLVESGAADALDFDNAELALCCASHNGEGVHVKSARVMLIKAGLSEDDLECGSQWPKRLEDIADLVRADEEPGALYNNCSGKHAGFLGLAKVLGAPTKGYVLPDHPVQQEIKATVEEFTGEALTADVCGTDGCSIPTYASPLKGIARAFAVFGTGKDLEPNRAQACERLYEACVNEPFMVAGTERFCTDIMAAFKGRVFVKFGAEGVFCASIPEKGLGVALKCDDGGTRGAETMMGAVLEVLLDKSEEEAKALDAYVNPPIRTRVGFEAGEVRPSETFLSALKDALA
ncbi:asparaginase [Roseibium polysiphoniae]|uniref:Asparaginase n=1 Tax=Roseibium polysiphoniae TaxID=2571221 RepID=A0A944GQP1_9HYPH|nr:asparaginase [Roseibium polysiphoniae]MBS8258654.1 asparaginase [Roseibium polysiphoniae]